jgi:hypothetical protein
MQAGREKNRAQLEELRAARQRGDTAAVRKAFEARRDLMLQEREQHVAAIRSILSAEQRVQFDKNVAELKTRMAERGARPGKGMRGQRGPRGGVRGPGGR